MGLEGALAESLDDPAAEVPAHFGGGAGEFGQSFHHVAQRVDVVHAGPLHLCSPRLDLLAGCGLHPNFLQIEGVRSRVSPHREQHRIELLRTPQLLGELVLHSHLQFAVLPLGDAGGEGGLDYVDLPLSQVVQQDADHVAVEGAQVVPPRHQTHLVPHALQEACDFDCHVASPHDQGLAWGCLLHEDVVAGDGVLRTFDFEVGRTGASGDQEVLGLDLVVGRVVGVQRGEGSGFHVLMDNPCIFGADNGVFVLEGGQTVEVLHPLGLVDAGDVPEIDGLDIALHFGPQRLPVELLREGVAAALVDPQLPAVLVGVEQFLVGLGGLVHQLLGDAAHVHAGPAQPPLRLVDALLHEVHHDHLQPVLVRLEGRRQSSRPAPDHCQVVLRRVFPGHRQGVPHEGGGERDGGSGDQGAFESCGCARIIQEPSQPFPQHNNYDQTGDPKEQGQRLASRSSDSPTNWLRTDCHSASRGGSRMRQGLILVEVSWSCAREWWKGAAGVGCRARSMARWSWECMLSESMMRSSIVCVSCFSISTVCLWVSSSAPLLSNSEHCLLIWCVLLANSELVSRITLRPCSSPGSNTAVENLSWMFFSDSVCFLSSWLSLSLHSSWQAMRLQSSLDSLSFSLTCSSSSLCQVCLLIMVSFSLLMRQFLSRSFLFSFSSTPILSFSSLVSSCSSPCFRCSSSFSFCSRTSSRFTLSASRITQEFVCSSCMRCRFLWSAFWSASLSVSSAQLLMTSISLPRAFSHHLLWLCMPSSSFCSLRMWSSSSSSFSCFYSSSSCRFSISYSIITSCSFSTPSFYQNWLILPQQYSVFCRSGLLAGGCVLALSFSSLYLCMSLLNWFSLFASSICSCYCSTDHSARHFETSYLIVFFYSSSLLTCVCSSALDLLLSVSWERTSSRAMVLICDSFFSFQRVVFSSCSAAVDFLSAVLKFSISRLSCETCASRQSLVFSTDSRLLILCAVSQPFSRSPSNSACRLTISVYLWVSVTDRLVQAFSVQTSWAVADYSSCLVLANSARTSPISSFSLYSQELDSFSAVSDGLLSSLPPLAAGGGSGLKTWNKLPAVGASTTTSCILMKLAFSISFLELLLRLRRFLRFSTPVQATARLTLSLSLPSMRYSLSARVFLSAASARLKARVARALPLFWISRRMGVCWQRWEAGSQRRSVLISKSQLNQAVPFLKLGCELPVATTCCFSVFQTACSAVRPHPRCSLLTCCSWISKVQT